MKPFPLEKVLDYRRHLRVERRNALAAAMSEEQSLLDQRSEVESRKAETVSQLQSMTRPGELNVEAAARRRYFVGQLDIRILILAEQIEQAHAVVEQRRQELIVADQEVRMLERLREKHVEEETAGQLRRTELELADQWQAARFHH